MLLFLARAFTVIGIIASMLLLAGILLAMHARQRAPEEPENVILTLDLDQPIVEQSEPSPLQLAIHEDTTPLLTILRAIDQAKEDPHVKGLIATFGSTQPSLAHAQEIRAALGRFRTTKKFTYAFAASYGSFGLGNRAYYTASAFENIWLQPVGSVSLTGLAIQSPFGKTALQKLGVNADFMQREEYKSVMEMATRDDFSPPVKQMMQGMLDDLSEQISGGIAESRGWNVDRVKRLMAAGPYTDTEAEQAGLVTRIGYADELADEAKEKAGKDAQLVGAEEYLGFGGHGRSSKPKARIAVIYGDGLIVDKNTGPGDISGDKIMSADTVAQAFDDAAEDKNIKAILFRVDSPGGSPEASETIRRALVHAQKMGKPVVVSMGDVAASGGYWIAMNGDSIIADGGTLTGSIGVVSGKFVLSGLMQKLGVTIGTLKTTENAGMWSMTENFTPAQRARVNALLDQTYHAFIKNVSDARHIPMEKMPEIAKGRVWTGAQAVKLGLVDDLGGYDVALGALRSKLKLAPTDLISMEVFPPPETAVEKVMKLLRNVGIEASILRPMLGEIQFFNARLGPYIGDMQMKPVDARMPNAALGLTR